MEILASRASTGYVDARLTRDFYKNHETCKSAANN